MFFKAIQLLNTTEKYIVEEVSVIDITLAIYNEYWV